MVFSQSLTFFVKFIRALGGSRYAITHALNQRSPDTGATLLLIRGHQAGALIQSAEVLLSPVQRRGLPNAPPL
jgi:hypothetical protein